MEGRIGSGGYVPASANGSDIITWLFSSPNEVVSSA